MVVQHNLTAMNSNRMLGLTKNTQAKSTEKLSSGYKINRAADDAAGLSISEKMRKQIRGLTQASTNAQDGISAVQTAEGALNEVQDMLQRMNELAVKSANGTNSSDDRSYIQDEIDQLVTEIDRVAETTKFNETYLLKGDEKGVAKTKFQYKEANVLKQDVYYMDSNNKPTKVDAGKYFDNLDTTKAYYSTDDIAKVGIKMDSTGLSAINVVTAANVYSKNNDEYILLDKNTVVASNAVLFTGEYNASATYQALGSVNASDYSGTKYTNKSVAYDSTGKTYAAGKLIVDDSANYANYYGGIGSAALMQGGTINISSMSEKAKVQFTDKDGNEIAQNGLYRYINSNGEITGDLRINGEAASKDDVEKLVDYKGKFNRGVLELKLHVGADATDNNQISVELEAMSSEELGVKDIKVDGTDDTKARDAIETIKEALQKVSTQRSALGAVQNRLEHTINNLDNVVENTTSAESLIRDTDMAKEMVKYSNNNILAQAGQAMLAQANQSNQGVLSLLG